MLDLNEHTRYEVYKSENSFSRDHHMVSDECCDSLNTVDSSYLTNFLQE